MRHGGSFLLWTDRLRLWVEGLVFVGEVGSKEDMLQVANEQNSEEIICSVLTNQVPRRLVWSSLRFTGAQRDIAQSSEGQH